VPLPVFQPFALSRAREPFSHFDWIFEIKWGRSRALLSSDSDGVRLISRKRNTFKSFPSLCEGLAHGLKGRRCVLDGEIVCLDPNGKPQLRDLLFRRAEPFFYAFDVLSDEHAWSDDEMEMRSFRNGEDTRYLPLIDRKLRLRGIVPKRGERLLTVITSTFMENNCSGWRVNKTLRESWRSGKAIRTYQTMLNE
jgi:bifunctional non-homologous end joining protein LigD